MSRAAAFAALVAAAALAAGGTTGDRRPVGWLWQRAVSLQPETDVHTLTGREAWILPYRFAPSGESALVQVLPAGIYTNAALGAVFDCSPPACVDFARRTRRSGLARRPCIVDLEHASCRDPAADYFGIVTNLWADERGVWAAVALNAEGGALLRTGGVLRASAAMQSLDEMDGRWRVVRPWLLTSIALTASPVLPTAPAELLP